MAFTYLPGTTTPNLAGLIQTTLMVGSDPFRINDGTFELLGAPGLLWGTPNVRSAVAELPSDDGGFAGLPFNGPREFILNGNLKVPTIADMWSAIDLLWQAFTLTDLATALPTLQLLTVNTSGWAHKRQIAARINGELSITPPADLDGHLALKRGFSVPMIAPDPWLYNADTLQAVTVTTTNLTNNGNRNTPFVVRFNGPRVDPHLDGPGLTGKQIKYIGTIASGHWVEVGTNPAGDGTGLYAVDDSGADVFASLSAFTARVIPPGTTSWGTGSTSGSGNIVVSFRDAWA
jgi:hypothetical protein